MEGEKDYFEMYEEVAQRSAANVKNTTRAVNYFRISVTVFLISVLALFILLYIRDQQVISKLNRRGEENARVLNFIKAINDPKSDINKKSAASTQRLVGQIVTEVQKDEKDIKVNQSLLFDLEILLRRNGFK